MKKLIILMITLVLLSYSCGEDKNNSKEMNKNELQARLIELCNTYDANKGTCIDQFGKIVQSCKDYNSERAVKYYEHTEKLYMCSEKESEKQCDEFKDMMKNDLKNMCSNYKDLIN